MQDAFAYCAELVRSADRDRYLATLFAPAVHRDALFALYAFNVETGRVREAAREPLPGEMRLQWWSEVLGGARSGEAAANPVAATLLSAIERYGLAENGLLELIEARRFDLYDEPLAALADLEDYVKKTSSAVIALAARILGIDAQPAASRAGIAHGLTGLIRALPKHAAGHRLYLPTELLERHGIRAHEIFAGESSDRLNAALADLRRLARGHLAAAAAPLMAQLRTADPAFLPVALVRPSLDRLDGSDAFAPREISPWRRQWLIWRAARNPARIAG
ncbi:MAG TPA: phytoene/squalene synthase family protein [Xanthobacteraceae bacterium]|nr:phytoene/squalene synthase family protein [Xanthobacteraceae bacterium]